MGDNHNPGVSVFSFTTHISTAKIRKYRMATERGMNPSHASPPPGAADDSTAAEPAIKKPRFKLNGPRRPSDPAGSDTIAVLRPQPNPNKDPLKWQYSDNMQISSEERSQTARTKNELPASAVSPSPSSGLSSLSSAPPSVQSPSEPEESSSADLAPSSRANLEYGDFASFYVQDDSEEVEPVTKPGPAGKRKPKPAAKAASKTTKSAPKSRSSKTQIPAPQVSKAQVSAPQTSNPPQQSHGHQLPVSQGHPPPQHGHMPPPPGQQHAPFQPQQHPPPGAPLMQHGPPPGASRMQHGRPGPPHGRPPPQGYPPQRPHPLPAPIVQFTDIIHPPRPMQPDTIPIMIAKLTELSSALTTFGGAPPEPTSPSPTPSPPPSPVLPAKTTAPAPASAGATNPVDNFLFLFEGLDGEDDDDEDKPDPTPANPAMPDPMLTDPGTPDGPLTHGIVFIQNALKSWAQQRVTQMYTTQFLEQNQSQPQGPLKRGPGRPRKFDDGPALLPPNPVIQMDLSQTPEGAAIKAFQAVLYSQCLRVNVRLPLKLSRALRRLYTQIDHLINQGDKVQQADWHCMSYGAQISAHKTRVEKARDAQAKQQAEVLRQQALADQRTRASMGLPQYLTPAQAELAHEIELETRRAQASAHQQPYIRQQHLPLQLGPHPPGVHVGFLPSQPANNGSRPSSAGHINGRADPMMQTASQNGAPNHRTADVQLDRMKMYVPGYLPRSGQSMKFSFTPHNDAAVSVFASNTLPTTENADSALPNRGPMSASPAQAMLHPSVDLSNASAGSRPTTAPTSLGAINADNAAASRRVNGQQSTLQPLTPAVDGQASTGNFRAHQRIETPVVATHGFTAVNAPAMQSARTASAPAGSPTDPSPETIKVAMKRPNGATASPRGGKKRNANEMNGSSDGKPATPSKRSTSEMNGHHENTAMPKKFPHPGAIVVDQ